MHPRAAAYALLATLAAFGFIAIAIAFAEDNPALAAPGGITLGSAVTALWLLLDAD